MASILKNSAEPRHDKQRNTFHLPISAWLSYLFIATLLFSSISLARYTASTSGKDNARVAKFIVGAEAVRNDDSEKILLNPSENPSATYLFTIENQSEVITEYSVIISNVPMGVQVTLYLEGEQIEMNRYVYEDTCTWMTSPKTLEINNSKLCELLFTADEGAEGATNTILVQIQFDQID